MRKYIVIGAGMSGLSIANILQEQGNEVVVFESELRPGGMIKCNRIDGNLFHQTGGHVFNSKRQDVLEWFWNHFDRENEFVKAFRNASVLMTDGKIIPYPIENHAYLFDEATMKSFINDLITIVKKDRKQPANFEEFLRGRFGETLYKIYFKPYNYKVWRRDLANVPLSWLEGKLPMPTVQEIIYNNVKHVEERAFVHSSFYYAKKDGSQFLANRLSEGLNIHYGEKVMTLKKLNNSWIINGIEADRIIYCGNIKHLPELLSGNIDISNFISSIENLESHGTTAVFCKIDPNPYSWIYMPSCKYESHRIICTGNFSSTNNAGEKMTATIEFTNNISKEDILDNLTRIPYHPQYIAHHYEKYTYPIQSATTRKVINEMKTVTERNGLYLLGRFAEWEYYNMDVAMGAAIDLSKRI